MTNDELVGALEDTYRSLLEVARTVDEDDWARPTDCPGWSVKDHLSHLAGMERVLLGEPESEHVPPAGLAHVHGEMAAYMEGPVDERRSWSGAAVLAELERLVDRRIAMLRELDAAGWDADARGLMGSQISPARFLPTIAFDRWVHEQDVRRAVNRPGNVSGPGAQIAMERCEAALPVVLTRKHDEPDGTRVDLVATGAHGRTVSVVWGEATSPTATITCDVETFVRLCAGRIDPLAAPVQVDGDDALGHRVLPMMVFTP